MKKTALVDLQNKFNDFNGKLWPELVAAQRGVDTNPGDPAGRARAETLLSERTNRKNDAAHEIQDLMRVLIEQAE